MSDLANAMAWIKEQTDAAQAGADTAKTDEDAKIALAQAKMKAADAAVTQAQQAIDQGRAAETAKKQAIFDAVYAVAAADGFVSDAERAKMAAALSSLIGTIDEATTNSLFATAKTFFDQNGLEGTAKQIAEVVPEKEGRSALLVIASAVAWLDRGVGTNEGLALQSLARHFDIPIHELHKLMVVGKI
jgi:tellurite resistance protein